jgi:hypothetical protein
MTFFTAAAAAALDLDQTSLANGMYAYPTVIRLDVSKNGPHAPALLSRLLAKMQLDEPTIVFLSHHDRHIDNDDLPQDKDGFDDAFAVTTRRLSLQCTFMIQSNRTFHQVKVGVWTLLQNHTIWMDKSPGPIEKTNLVPMGFWLHVHPGFASTRAFNTQLCKDLRDRYADVDRKALNLPNEFADPEMYFQATKCRGIYDGAAIKIQTPWSCLARLRISIALPSC